jgi:hypothetical protein
MIKYTGYGNAAGLFAQRGLLGGRSDKGEADYSSGSEGSETEEYAEYKHGINPVIGCYEEPHPNAMENMTEEQVEIIQKCFFTVGSKNTTCLRCEAFVIV